MLMVRSSILTTCCHLKQREHRLEEVPEEIFALLSKDLRADDGKDGSEDQKDAKRVEDRDNCKLESAIVGVKQFRSHRRMKEH
eukprot:761220-Hanusia_phi.AAC.1